METNKTIMSRAVVALEGRSTVGVVKQLLVNCPRSRIAYLIVSDQSIGAVSYLPFENVISIGDRFITIKNKEQLISSSNPLAQSISDKVSPLIDVEILSEDGNHYGFVKGFDFDSTTGNLTTIDTFTSGTLDVASKVLFLDPNYVFIAAGKKATKDDVAAVEAFVAAEDAADVTDVLEPVVAAEPVVEAAAPEVDPDFVSEDDDLADLLVGLAVGEDVVSDDGEFTVAKGTTITEEILADAQKHNAVVELTMSVDI